MYNLVSNMKIKIQNIFITQESPFVPLSGQSLTKGQLLF